MLCLLLLCPASDVKGTTSPTKSGQRRPHTAASTTTDTPDPGEKGQYQL